MVSGAGQGPAGSTTRGGNRGDTARWQGRSVTLGDNAYAQHAWAKYTDAHRAEIRVRGSSHLGQPLGSRRLHRWLEPVLHAVLGGDAHREAHPHHSLKRQSAKPRGICTSGLTRSANHLNS